MTISSTTRRAGPFQGNGATTSFPFTFKIFDKTDIAVTLADSSDNETRLVLDTDYSVTVNADQNGSPGGSITYPITGSPMDAAHTVIMIGALEELQPTQLANNGGFYPATIENALDRAVILIQQQSEIVARAITVPVADNITAHQLPGNSARSLRALIFDADGNPTVSAEPYGESGAVLAAAEAYTDSAIVAATPGIEAAAVATAGTNAAAQIAGATPGIEAAAVATAATNTAAQIAGATPTIIASAVGISDSHTASAIAGIMTPTFMAYTPTVLLNGRDFTAGTSTAVTIPATGSAKTISGVFMDGVYQSSTQYTLDPTGTIVGFNGVIPAGTAEIDVMYFSASRLGVYFASGIGAVGRTFEDKIRGLGSSPEDFGAVGDGAHDDTLPVQAWANAGGRLTASGTYLLSATINFTKAFELEGAGRQSCVFNQNTNFTTFSIAGFSGGFKMRGFTMNNFAATVTSGDAIDVSSAYNGSLEDIIANNMWNSFHVNTTQALYVSRVGSFFHKNAGIVCDGGNNNDATFRDCFIDGELAGAPHAAFGIWLQDKNEGVNFDSCEVILCQVVLQTGASVYNAGLRPAYCRFTNCYFDSGINGTQLSNCVELTFTACWFDAFGTGGTVGCTVGPDNSDSIVFLGCTFINTPQHGCVVDVGAKRTVFKGCKFISNSRSAPNTYSGLVFAAGTTDFIVVGNIFTNGLGFPGVQQYGVLVAAGASDRYIIKDNLVSGNGTAGVLDGGTGTNKAVEHNF